MPNPLTPEAAENRPIRIAVTVHSLCWLSPGCLGHERRDILDLHHHAKSTLTPIMLTGQWGRHGPFKP
jgi:hypothetical protein